MYHHKAFIKNNRVNIRLDDFEIEQLESLARLKGTQKSSLVYDVLLDYMQKELRNVTQFSSSRSVEK